MLITDGYTVPRMSAKVKKHGPRNRALLHMYVCAVTGACLGCRQSRGRRSTWAFAGMLLFTNRI